MSWSVILRVLSYVPLANPKMLVHIAGRIWEAILKTAVLTDLIRRDPLETIMMRFGKRQDNLFAISIYNVLIYSVFNVLGFTQQRQNK